MFLYPVAKDAWVLAGFLNFPPPMNHNLVEILTASLQMMPEETVHIANRRLIP